jgi:Fe-S-cluster containining protein
MTEMPLTRRDIERITSLGYPLEYFARRGADGVMYLRNVNGHCVFLDPDTGRCKIYPWRPEGCRLYPLVYDPENDEVIVDPDCPLADTIPKHVVKALEPRVRKLVKELYGLAE